MIKNIAQILHYEERIPTCKAGVTTNSATASNCVSLYNLSGIH